MRSNSKSHHDVPFQTKTLKKGMNLLIPYSYESNSIIFLNSIYSSTRIALALSNPWRLRCHKTSKPNANIHWFMKRQMFGCLMAYQSLWVIYYRILFYSYVICLDGYCILSTLGCWKNRTKQKKKKRRYIYIYIYIYIYLYILSSTDRLFCSIRTPQCC